MSQHKRKGDKHLKSLSFLTRNTLSVNNKFNKMKNLI